MKPALRWIRITLFILGGAFLGWVAFVSAEAALFQHYQTMRLDSGLRAAPRIELAPFAAPAPHSVVGRIEIPRLRLAVIVVEGDDARSLQLGAGHIPGTALPWQSGNVAIAGHRDTFFRPLRAIAVGDTVTLTTLRGFFRYRVENASVVGPDDTKVLDPTPEPTLTLVTCYPFYYIGPAPRRFVVRARRVS
jgi:sortase A